MSAPAWRQATHGWSATGDGAWYRRAYFDDGTPLGSAANSTECRIDSIVAELGRAVGRADPAAGAQAMDAVDQPPGAPQDGLVQLLDPPFDTPSLNPATSAGYVPGVRENGGQYTHAAIWAAMAFAELGDSRRGPGN
jgi:cyclic beta-1,2-glucan synthetase